MVVSKGVNCVSPIRCNFWEEWLRHSDIKNWSFTGAEHKGEIFLCLKHLQLKYCKKLNVGLPIGCLPSMKKDYSRVMLGNGGCHSNKSSRNWHRISLSLVYPPLEMSKIGVVFGNGIALQFKNSFASWFLNVHREPHELESTQTLLSSIVTSWRIWIWRGDRFISEGRAAFPLFVVSTPLIL